MLDFTDSWDGVKTILKVGFAGSVFVCFFLCLLETLMSGSCENRMVAITMTVKQEEKKFLTIR